MPFFYSKRVKNPCGRCNFACDDDSCISCTVCGKQYHRKCLKLSVKKMNDLKLSDSFKCSKKCEFTVFPFHSVGDKMFYSVNVGKKKFPCYVCQNECYKSMERIQCETCRQWAHIKCINLDREKADRLQHFTCSEKCELNELPFCALNSHDFDKVVISQKFNLQKYENKTSKDPRYQLNSDKGHGKDKPEPKPQCEYLEPS